MEQQSESTCVPEKDNFIHSEEKKVQNNQSENKVFERSSQSPHLIQENMFECDSHV